MVTEFINCLVGICVVAAVVTCGVTEVEVVVSVAVPGVVIMLVTSVVSSVEPCEVHVPVAVSFPMT